MDRPWERAMHPKILFPPSHPEPTLGTGEAEPTLLMSWVMEQDQGLFHLICKCSSALFGEQDQSRKAVLSAKPCA